MKVVLTREAGRNDSLEEWLPEGASCSEVPLTRTEYYELARVRAALEGSGSWGRYRSLVVTSERTQRYVAMAMDASAPDVELFSVGPATSAALKGRGLRVHVEGDGGSMALEPLIVHGPVLVLGAKQMRDELAEALRGRALEVAVVGCYETLALVPSDADQALLADADVIFIGAPSSWEVARGFVAPDAWIVVPGATTGAVVAAQHERVLEGWGPSLRQRLEVVE